MQYRSIIIINPHNRSVSEEPWLGEEIIGYEMVQTLMARDPDYSGTFAVLELGGGTVMYIDDNGCLSEGRPVFEFNGNQVAGVAMILDSKATIEGQETVATRRRGEEIVPAVKWTNLETTGEFGATTTEEGAASFIVRVGEPIFREKVTTDTA